MTGIKIKCVFGNCKAQYQCRSNCLGVCQHNRLNSFKDEHLDCGAILAGNKWKYGRSKSEVIRYYETK